MAHSTIGALVVDDGCVNEQNPVVGAWSQCKRSMANLAAGTLDRLAALVRTRLKRLQYRPGILDGFIAETGLALDPQPP